MSQNVSQLVDWIYCNFIPDAEKESNEAAKACLEKELEDFTRVFVRPEILVINFTDNTSLVLTAGQRDSDVDEDFDSNYRTCRATLVTREGS